MKQLDKELTWLDSVKFSFRDFERIDSEIKRAKKDFDDFLKLKEREKAEIEARFGFMRKILVSTEDPALDPGDRLSASVGEALEFLGFQVRNAGEEIQKVINSETCCVRDEDYFAITEITATVERNLTFREYSHLLGRMVAILQRRDLLPECDTLRGLLIANHDSLNNPFDRPKLYEGKEAEFVEAAKGQGIGLLSTVELYKFVVAVKDSVMTKADAIQILKQPGRIELDIST